MSGLTLLPCPFCGNTPKLTDYHGNYNKPPEHVVHCDHCDLSLDGRPTPAEAVALWNRRAATPADVGEEPVASDIDWITTAHVFCDRLGIERKAEAKHICEGIARVVRERDELRRGIAGKPGLEQLSHGQYLEMAHTLHAALDGGRSRAESADAKLAGARDVIENAVPAYEPWMDKYPNDALSWVYRPMTYGGIRAARRFLEETK